MIDIHTHILPNIDDGSKSLDDSIMLLRTCQEDGIKGLVLTSHLAPLRGFMPTKEALIKAYEQLVQRAQDENISIDLYLGAEIDEQDKMLNVIENSYTINNTPFVLIDFGMRRADISEVIYSLKIKGYKTIVAHPERYEYLDFQDLIKIKKEGGIFQVSALHLVKKGSKNAQKIAQKLLKLDMIDVVASDMHHKGHIHTMKDAYLYVEKKKGIDYARRLFIDNPSKIIGIK